jgi:transcriptional regulator with XRE-family HTH domain
MGKHGAKSETERAFNVLIGSCIEMERRKAGLRQVDLAAQAGITSSMLYAYESGGTGCPPYRLRLIAQALGVGVQQLMPENKR